MRFAFLALILVLSACAHSSNDKNKIDYSPYAMHQCSNFRTTPAGHFVCDQVQGSVTAGFTTNADIDKAVDAGFTFFEARFPEFAGLKTKVILQDDYVFRGGGVPELGVWCAGYGSGKGSYFVWVAIWSTGVAANGTKPVAWIVRPPGLYVDQRITQTHYTKPPLVPALAHELLHVAIGDPEHKGPEWARLK